MDKALIHIDLTYNYKKLDRLMGQNKAPINSLFFFVQKTCEDEIMDSRSTTAYRTCNAAVIY